MICNFDNLLLQKNLVLLINVYCATKQCYSLVVTMQISFKRKHAVCQTTKKKCGCKDTAFVFELDCCAQARKPLGEKSAPTQSKGFADVCFIPFSVGFELNACCFASLSKSF